MFDLNDKDSTQLVPARADERDLSPGEQADQQPANPLDSEKAVELHSRLLSYYRQELSRQQENRCEMAVDEDYYDNIQWTQEELDELKERGQSPTVYNVISQSVNWIIGSEKRGRSDFKVLPRRKEGGKAAERKTALLKYLSDVNHTPFERSMAFEEAVKAGIGWLESQIQDENDGEPIYAGAESWRNMLWDSTYRRLDADDCRYMFRSKWVDLDVAIAIFPEREAQLRAAAVDNFETWGADDIDGDDAMDSNEYERSMNSVVAGAVAYTRQRVRMLEAWFRMPVRVQRLRGRNSDFRGEVFDPNDERHVNEVATGRAVLAVAPMMRMHCAIMTTRDLMWAGPSPYRHNRYPFTPIWGFRRARDGMPYGVIRFMRGMQDDVNKRLSKALYILSANKVMMEEGAVDDIEEFRREIARPDSVNVVKNGKLGAVKLDVDRDLAPAHLELASRSIQMIQQVGGVTDEMLGRTTNAVSGVAIQARQEQGSVATNKLFDNLRLAFQQHGEKELSLIEQYMTEEKQFRITNSRGNPEYVAVNDGLPENDITRTKADFIIDEAEWRATMRQAAVAELLELIGKMPPQIAITMLDLLVENMDIPNRDELVKRIRAVNGQKDPDATEPTPEEIQREQAQQQEQQYQDELALATLAEQQAKARKADAEALVAEAKAKHIGRMAIREGVGAVKDATDAATSIAFMPELATLSDGILKESGWDDPNTPQPAAAASGTPPAPAQPAQPANPAQPPVPGQAASQAQPALPANPPQPPGPVTPDGAAPQQPM
ncbi:phage portal protein [Burkholderia phage BcepIL02]|uniref:Phage portal protein n=1 Tax=Burkholderia phage BcepIL02 TaxID=2886898 RepID=C5IHN8_9CAUD|nr:portal protein [Burkholderia phage BcepIL02]ACR15039.1 phage portal protein [Burkholderia phage BcepIL02]